MLGIWESPDILTDVIWSKELAMPDKLVCVGHFEGSIRSSREAGGGAPPRSSWQGDLQGSLSPTRESIVLGCVICLVTTIDSRAGHKVQ